MAWSLRPAGPEDAAQVARLQFEGFDGYRSFAPEGWAPPELGAARDHIRERLADPEVWCLVAEEEGEPAGHVAFLPARLHPKTSDDPGLAHFWQLFVSEPWWGTGLATTLHAEAVREAAARGFAAFRLFTPAEQARARRFYEREGWTVFADPADAPDFGMPLVEYRLAIKSSV